MSGPPAELVRSLVEGPSAVSAIEWHDELDSTNRRALQLAADGVAEIHVVAADYQSAGRGRQGRHWQAPPGTSLLLSLLVRPPVPTGSLGLLPLLTGLVVAEVAERFVPEASVALKWPNDLLIGPSGGGTGLRKAAGILVEGSGGAAVVGIGVNVDWRGVDRPADIASIATSLAEARDGDVDRWRLLAALLGVFANRYDAWCALPAAFLDGYRTRCATLGQEVRISRAGADPIEGVALDIAPTGALQVAVDGGTVEVAAGDVTHIRPAGAA
jgi:BirA family transcriptional regulator, biotin operon repressor / biotin---[acetyl-CoA-carboxylase] ligase